MTLDKYIRSSRTLQQKPPPEMPVYLPTYASLLKVLSTSNPSLLNSNLFPHLVIVYSLQRSHELVRIDGERYLIYDQYLGQTFNMLNRIWANSEDARDGEMYALKLLAEHYAALTWNSADAMRLGVSFTGTGTHDT